MKRLLFASLVILFLWSPSGAVERDEATDSKLMLLRDVGLEILKHPCSKPSRVHTNDVVNEYNPAIIDSIRTIKCHGIEATTYHAKFYNPPKAFPYAVIVTDSRRKLPYGLAVGEQAAAIESELGEPDRAEKTTFSYLFPEEGPCSGSISFTVQNKQIEKITWSFCLD